MTIWSLSKFYSLLLILVFMGCGNGNTSFNDKIEVYNNFDQLANRIFDDSDTTYVVNFWATTCPPCIKEMPHFDQLNQALTPKHKVLLISLDDLKNIDSRVLPFVEKHQIYSEVNLLVDENYSAWTDDIDPSWFGALPATFILNGKNRHFKFGAYESFEELHNDVEKVK